MESKDIFYKDEKLNGQSQCYRCKQKGKWNVSWSSWMWNSRLDKHHQYCDECKKELEQEYAGKDLFELFDEKIERLEKKEQLLNELCDFFGFDNLFPYEDLDAIEKAFKNMLDRLYEFQFSKLHFERKCSKQQKILDILRKGFILKGNIIKYEGFNQENWDKVEEWLKNYYEAEGE
jgi:hypothetical protein